MKLVATFALATLLLASGAIRTIASPSTGWHRVSLAHYAGIEARLAQSRFGSAQQGLVRQQTSTTATPTATATTPTPGTPTPGTVTPTPSPTPTVTSTGPDPAALLQQAFTTFEKQSTVHFDDTVNLEQKNVEKVTLHGVGDDTCKGPSFTTHVKASDTDETTKKTRNVDVHFVVIKNQAYVKGKVTKNKWTKLKLSQATVYSVPISTEQWLVCPSSSSGSGSSSGSSSGTSIKDLVNLGAETFQGVSVWHVTATEIVTDSTGTVTAKLDFLISKSHPLPLREKVNALLDATNNVTFKESTTYSKYGEKVSIKAPTK